MSDGADKKVQGVKEELEKMSYEQQINELIYWRLAVPTIQKMTNQLAEFRQYASTPDELAEKIRQLSAKYEAMLQFREEQLTELMKLVESVQSDPVGASKHIEAMAKLGLRKKLN